MTDDFEPRIVAFLCKWCSYTGADLAGTSRIEYPANVVPIKVMCSGRVDPTFVLKAFSDGADGVLICGCHPGDCHYNIGNYNMQKRVPFIKSLIKGMGIEEERFRLEWVSAAEGDKFAEVVGDITEKLKQLGPLNFKDAKEEVVK
ncbi:MAG: hydrogenase iron-sulfur subunit [Candidatus Goldiibacteriota bacterium]